jgi:diadenosine tetraphosphate (Ap4A) HIT family hydrolase
VSCYGCENNARLDELPPRERIVLHDGWRVVHAFNTSLRGWLVLVPMRHVERFSELTDEEIVAFGPLARACSRALEAEVGCAKTYLVVLGEQPGFEHLHAHVIPRMPDVEATIKGTGVFSLLDRPEEEWVPEHERDELALALRGRLRPELR